MQSLHFFTNCFFSLSYYLWQIYCRFAYPMAFANHIFYGKVCRVDNYIQYMKKRSHIIVTYVVASFQNQVDSKNHIAIHVRKIELILIIKLNHSLRKYTWKHQLIYFARFWKFSSYTVYLVQSINPQLHYYFQILPLTKDM